VKVNSKDIALAAILGALYVVIGGPWSPLHLVSFGLFQCRVSDALYPLIGLFGIWSLIGLVIGHFIFNFLGLMTGFALGPLDMLSVPLFIPAKIAIWKWGFKAVPLHVISVGLWVPYLLMIMFGVPYWIGVVTVTGGEIIAELGIGGLLYYGIKRRLGR